MSYCRVCSELTDSILLECFQNLAIKRTGSERYKYHICGISIAQDDTHPDGICRKCERFVNKMWLFRQTCQQVQINLRQMKSIKRLSSSPMEKPGNKRQNLNLVTSVYHNDYNSHVTACISPNEKQTFEKALYSATTSNSIYCIISCK